MLPNEALPPGEREGSENLGHWYSQHKLPGVDTSTYTSQGKFKEKRDIISKMPTCSCIAYRIIYNRMLINKFIVTLKKIVS